MKEYTKFLKEENKKDKQNIYYHNNSKFNKRTPEQNEQARRDKYNYYYKKWSELLEKCDTEAQKDYCNDILCRLHIIK